MDAESVYQALRTGPTAARLAQTFAAPGGVSFGGRAGGLGRKRWTDSGAGFSWRKKSLTVQTVEIIVSTFVDTTNLIASG